MANLDPVVGFEQAGTRVVEVGPNFPRMTAGSVPAGIIRAMYEIDLDKAPGDKLYAGTLNAQSELELRVTAATGNTTLDRIIRAVEEAQGSRAPTQRFVDRFAAIYTPAVFVMSLGVAVGSADGVAVAAGGGRVVGSGLAVGVGLQAGGQTGAGKSCGAVVAAAR